MPPDENPTGKYKDDPASIPDEAELLRRVHPAFVIWEKSGPRVTSQAFQDYPQEAVQRLGMQTPCMSVALLAILRAEGHGPEKLLEMADSSYGVVVLSAGMLRSLGEGAMPWPTPAEPWHGIVFVIGGEKRRRSVRAAIADEARWIIVPRH